MSQITARIPDELLALLDQAAAELHRTRAEVIRQAVEYYLKDYEDLASSIAVLKDPSDAVLEWGEVRERLLAED